MLRDHFIKSLLVLGGAFFSVIVTAFALWMLPISSLGQFFWVFLFFGSLFITAMTLISLWLGVLQVSFFSKDPIFFGKALDLFGQAVVITDFSGNVLFCNQLYKSLLAQGGYRHDVGPETLYAAYPEGSAGLYRLTQALLERKAGREDFRLTQSSPGPLTRGGVPLWIRLEAVPFLFSQQDCVLWRICDITSDRAYQEDALKHAARTLSILDHMPAGAFSLDKTGKVIYVNETLAAWTGQAKPFSSAPIALDRLFDGKGVAALLKPSFGKKQGSTEVFELMLRGGEGGRTVLVLRRRGGGEDFSSTGQPFLVIDPSCLGQGSFLDRAVEAERLIERAPVGIGEISREGVITQANAAFLNFCPTFSVGQKLQTYLDASQDSGLDTFLKAVWSVDDDHGYGQARSESLSLDVAFRGEKNKTARLFCEYPSAPGQDKTTLYIVDTSRSSALEVQLSQSRKMLAIGQLAGGIAHDFNNVLTAIIGFSDLLLARHKPTDPSFADIMNIKQNANRAANLVRQLLAFSRRQTLRPEVTSLTDIVSDLAHLLGRLLGEKVALRVTHDRGVGFVKVDINQFEQVVINLCVNARDAMPEGGELTIRTYNLEEEASKAIRPGLMPPGRYVVCEVRDTGLGMDPEVLDKIFEPFFTTKEVGKGTGLGLSTVYGIVKQTGGFIFCESAPNEGTIFSIYLPRFDEKDIVLPPAQEEKKLQKSKDLTGHGTILLVEDEDAVRTFASRALQSRGYTVLTAATGEEAIHFFEDQKEDIHLILSDVVMPGMDGPTLLKELRRRGIETKMIFISGYAEDAFEKNLEGHDDFTFLPKPFTLKQLAETVKEAIDQGE